MFRDSDTQLQKRTKKLKQVKEDNRKLRQLLKAQLENSEKIRIETQTTVETLREEFDLLVRELSNIQKKENDEIGNGNQVGQGFIQPLNNKFINSQNQQPQQQQQQFQQQVGINGNNIQQNQNVQQGQNQQKKQQIGGMPIQIPLPNPQQAQNFKIQQAQQYNDNIKANQISNIQGGQQQQQNYNQIQNQQPIPVKQVYQVQNLLPQNQPINNSRNMQVGSFGSTNNSNNNSSFNNSNNPTNNNNQNTPLQVKHLNNNNFV